jgi:hypothetical protein
MVLSKKVVVPTDSTYLFELETFMFAMYRGWNGTMNVDGQAERDMHFQTCTNNLQTDWSQDLV